MKKRQMTKPTGIPENYEAIRTGIVDLLHAAKRVAARNVNSLMTAAYWEIGRRIIQSEQRGEARAGYGEQLIEQLASDLSQAVWPRIRASQPLANACILPGMARSKDSPDTVWRICNCHIIQ